MPVAAPTAGLLMLFRADSLSALADGAAVTSWVDSIGFRELITRNAAPTKLASGAGSQPAVRLNGTSQALQMSAPPAIAQPFTRVMILRSAVTTSATDRQALFQGSGGELVATAAGQWQDYGGAPRLATTPLITTNPTIVTSIFNGDSQTSEMYVNGTLAVRANVGTGAMDQGLLILGNNPANARWWNGDFYEVRVYDHVLTAAERQQLHSYAQDRYAITVSDYSAGAGDTTAPTVPTNLAVSATSSNSVSTSWTASTDAVGTTSYRIRRNGADLATVNSPTTAYVDNTVQPQTNYTYTVSAIDLAGNRSAESSAASVTTPAAPDTTAPSVPSNLVATATTTPSIGLSWGASTDAVSGVTYRIRRNGTTLVESQTATFYTDTVITPGVSYTYTVSAVDAAGNRSAESATATATAASSAPGGLRSFLLAATPILQRSSRWSGSQLIDRISDRLTGSTGGGGTTPTPDPTPTTFPQAFGTLSARPSWTNAAAAAGPLDQPAATTRTRTLTLPNMPAEGGDILAAWKGYFGDRVGNLGTKQSGDRVIIPGGLYRFSDNLDIPDHGSDIEVVLGTEGSPTTLRSSQISGGLVNQHTVRVLGAAKIRIRGVSKTTPATIETASVVGRTGLNQQGNTMLLLDPGTADFFGQDLILRGARAAGFFAYRATRYWLNRVTVEESLADGFHNTNGSSYGIFTDCVSRRAGDDGWAAVYYDGGGLDGQSHHLEVYRLLVDTNGHGRGFANICCSDIYADQVIVRGSAAAGVIIDREAVSGGSAHGNIERTLLQRFLVEGSNWSEQDHGSVFLRNGLTNGTVTGVVCESFEIRDAAANKQVVRTIGDGSANAVLECTLTDFRFTGGTTTVANDQFGGNNITRITRSGWANTNSTPNVEKVNPTVVINTPGRFATVSGSMAGSTTDTSAMRNTQAIQFYAGDAGTKVSGANIVGIATVQVRVGDTVLGTISPSGLDSAKRGSQAWDTTRFVNGPARITLIVTDQIGLVTTRTRDVVVANTTPGTLAGMPA